ncbi:peptidoglycan DD-metalloendopeptidase family protein [bacterium]|nr:peptidoglycan DD-metalloendopeptidase family protein [bacterium]
MQTKSKLFSTASIAVFIISLLLQPLNTLAASPEQRINIERRPWFDPTDIACTNTTAPGTNQSTVQPGPIYIVGDSVMDGAKSKVEPTITAAGWQPKFNTLVSRKLSGTPPNPDGFGAIALDGDFIKTAKAVVIELGTNPSSEFSKKVPEFVQAIKQLNSAVTIYWIDTASPGRSDFQNHIKNANTAIYNNSTSSGYKVISWFKKVFGDSSDPLNPSSTAPDTGKLISTADGLNVHPTDAGKQAMADIVLQNIGGQTPAQAAIAMNTRTKAIIDSQLKILAADTGQANTAPIAVPEPYASIFPKAAARHGTDPIFLATIFLAEHGGGFPNPPPPYGTGGRWATSNKGANGPFQFLVSTWAGKKQDADRMTVKKFNSNETIEVGGDGTTDIQDLADAAFGAAQYLAEAGGKVGTPLGDTVNPMAENTLTSAMVAYNAGGGNLNKWRRCGTSLSCIGAAETRKYVTNGVNYYQRLGGQLNVDPGATTTNQTCSDGSSTTPGGGLGVSADGFVFPLKTTKAVIRQGADGAVWCIQAQNNCHHDYNAADIHAPTGTIVVAARGGTVLSTRTEVNYENGNTLRIQGDDGLWYYYAHMGDGTLKVKKGDKVTAGQELGAVGTSADAQGTAPHLHFDIADHENGFSRGRGGACGFECQNYLINPQPVLIAAFAKLPEN